MGTQQEKLKISKRRLQEQNAVKKQARIAKQHGLVNKYNEVDQPHRFSKHHALDNSVGNPEKFHSSKNPRKTFNELTIQEQRLLQDVDHENNRHSNDS